MRKWDYQNGCWQNDLFEQPEEESLFPPLREFQKSTHIKLREGFKAGHKRQIVMAPTGSGKTILSLYFIQQSLQKNKRCAFVCDRETLIEQTSAVADLYGLDHGIIKARHWRTDHSKQFQIASVQTLQNFKEWPNFDLVVHDEIHTSYATFRKFAEQSDIPVIGLSATPFTKGLGNIFSNLINAATMHELTEQGILVPLRVMSCHRPDMTGVKTVAGEWSDRVVEEKELELIGDVVLEWKKHADNRKTIIFGPTIKYCEELCRRFNDNGVMAATYTSDTKDDERIELKNEFSKTDTPLRILISVEALAKGFDQRDIECVVDCRPFRKSFSSVVQMIGRGLRCSPETEKKDCLLLDHSGNIIRFADDYSDLYFNGLSSLDTGEKLDAVARPDTAETREPKECPKCHYMPMGKRCIKCGYEPPIRASNIEHLPGSMDEIDLLCKKYNAPSLLNLWEQVSSYAKQHSTKADSGRGWACHLFKDLTGEFPNKLPHFDDVPIVPVSLAVQGKIRSRMIAFYKGQQKAKRRQTKW